ncbi:MAG: single-stranded DNA-binding protein [Dehalococcoidia bacterium]
MAGLNKVMLIGNVGKDPEMRYTANGNAVTTFSLACNRSFASPDGERREETDWFEIVTWNKLAELCSQFLQKGRQAYVEGRLHTRSWEGQDGQKRYRTEVVAQTVLFLDRAGSGNRPPAAATEAYDDAAPAAAPVDPDDLPFE